jgi:hypothetical protein
VERHGRSFTLTDVPPARAVPAAARITARVDEVSDSAAAGAYRTTGRAIARTRPAMSLRAETGADRLGKRVGIDREVQTGDAAFDAAVYIESDAPDEDVRAALADARVRRAVRELLAAGEARVELDPEGLTSVHNLDAARTPIAEADLDRITALLSEAASALPLFLAGRARPRALHGAVEAGAIVAGLALFCAMQWLGPAAPIDPEARLLGLGGGLAIALLVVPAIGLAVRGRWDSASRFVCFSITALLVLPMGLYTGLCCANELLDDSPPVRHTARVVHVRVGKGPTTYVELASWRADGRSADLTTTYDVSNPAEKTGKMTVTTRAGRFGWEWVVSFRPAP